MRRAREAPLSIKPALGPNQPRRDIVKLTARLSGRLTQKHVHSPTFRRMPRQPAAQLKELRAIIFTDEELEVALEEYGERSATPTQPGSIKSLAINDDPPKVDLTLGGPLGVDRLLTVSSEEVLCAIIEYCLVGKVPLPIMSTKTVEVVGERVALMISTFGEESRRPPRV